MVTKSRVEVFSNTFGYDLCKKALIAPQPAIGRRTAHAVFRRERGYFNTLAIHIFP
jgi:hypothetical protein